MSEVGTNERLLRSDVTLEESRKIERVLRRNNISYFEKWNFHTGGAAEQKRHNRRQSGA